jgi:ketosteroid isomerase-like protein
MTQSNTEIVREAFDRWNKGDRESLLAQIDPDVEIHVPSSLISGGEPYHGHDGYREWTATMEESFEVWEIRPETFEEHGDTVLVLGSMHLRGRGSGVELDQETGWVVDLRDGKMRRFQAFLGHAEALAGFTAPTSENVERIRSAFERWNAGDRTPPLEDFDEGIEIKTTIGEAFRGEPFRGHDGAREWLAGLDENFERWELVADEFHERADTVVVLGKVRARGRGSGVELDQGVGWVLRLRGGKVYSFQSFLNHEEALSAGGIS